MRLDLAAGLVTLVFIGVAISIVFDRIAKPSWLARAVDAPLANTVTSALIAIAGTFIGFHLANILEFERLALIIAGGIGALAVLYVWRKLR